MADYHTKRTVQWGNWGITFSDPNPNEMQNYGIVVGSVLFPLSTRGPFEGSKDKWEAACNAWVSERVKPQSFIAA